MSEDSREGQKETWHQERETVLARYAEGRTIAQICVETGWAKTSVWGVIKRAGLLRPSKKSLYHDQVLSDYQRGDTYSVIAERYELGTATVQNWIRDAGLKGQGGLKSVYADTAQQAIALYKEGRRYSEIADALGVARTTVATWIQEAAIPEGEGGPSLLAKRDAEEAIRLYTTGTTIEAICRQLGRTQKTVSQWLRDADITILSSLDRRTPEDQRAYGLRGGEATKAKAYGPDKRICAQCGKGYELPPAMRNSDQMFCSRTCALDARRDPDKKVSLVCQVCGVSFETWKARPAKYCSRACTDRGGVRGIQWRFQDNVLDSKWEVRFLALASWNNVTCERFNRTNAVTWNERGHAYGPDFEVTVRGQQIAIEIKGHQDEDDLLRWAAYRRTAGPLAVLDKELLEELRWLSPRAFADRLLALALTQGEQDS